LIEGPSGCGKTTLLEILGLLLPADSGELTIRETTVSGRWGEANRLRRNHIAFVFQDFNLLESLSAHDNVAIVAALHHRKPHETTRRMLNTLGLEHRARHRPAELSGGEKQRVAIGRALVSGACLLLADEPTANLDWSVGESIVKILANVVKDDNRSVVIVSHDPRLEMYADRVISLLDGRITGERSARTAIPEFSRSKGGAKLITVILLAVLGICVALGLVAAKEQRERAAATTLATVTEPHDDFAAAAPAVVEPHSRTIHLSCDRSGIIVAINANSGDTVAKGQVLVQLDDGEASAQLTCNQAQLASAVAALADLKAWTRKEVLEQSRADVDGSQARLAYEESRYKQLLAIRTVAASQLEVEQAQRSVEIARGELRRAQAKVEEDLAGPTPSQLKKAEAAVEEAKASVEYARVALQRRAIDSPIDGKVLYVHMRPGEAIDLQSPQPILSLAEAGKLRLRADVDEADIGNIFVGQSVLATTEAFPNAYHGKVVQMEPIMGRRNIRTNRPRERQDTRVREVLIELDEDGAELPVDLMMTVRFSRQAGGIASRAAETPAVGDRRVSPNDVGR
jgi:putative ABC transport system ATP-binding protein